MSERVKLTREQEIMFKNHEGAFETLMRKHRIENCPTVIDDLTTQQVVDAYFDGYEVEDTFDIGDFVIDTSGEVLEIKEKLPGDRYRLFFAKTRRKIIPDSKVIHLSSIVRMATKQEAWWAKHGRDVGELKRKDILIYLGDIYEIDRPVVIYPNSSVVVRFESGGDEFYEESINFVKNNFKLVCFAEDRKDV